MEHKRNQRQKPTAQIRIEKDANSKDASNDVSG
jgi:hypothetical protein